MILHDVPDYAELVKITATAFGAEGFLERNLDRRDVVSVPGRVEDAVAEPQRHEVLHHFFAKVVVDAVDLLLVEERCKVIGELLGSVRVTTEGLFDDDASPSSATKYGNFQKCKIVYGTLPRGHA